MNKAKERELAIEKIIKGFQMLDEGLDKGQTIYPNSTMHYAIKAILAVWMELQAT